MKKNLISLTFDDGWMSQYENAVPVLTQYGYTGTFYIITEFLYKKHSQRMFANNVTELHEKGHEIGSHSVSHPSLPYHFWKDVGSEIRDSKNALEDLLEQPVKSFAYPYGRYNNKIKKLVEATGYENARAVDGLERSKGFKGFNYSLTNKFEICCKSVKRGTSLEEVRIWIEIAKRNNFWLVLNFHQVVDKPSEWGCTPEMFSLVCQLIKVQNLQVETLSKSKELYFQNELVH